MVCSVGEGAVLEQVVAPGAIAAFAVTQKNASGLKAGGYAHLNSVWLRVHVDCGAGTVQRDVSGLQAWIRTGEAAAAAAG